MGQLRLALTGKKERSDPAGDSMKAPLCPKCRKRPRFTYKTKCDSGRFGPYCRKCLQQDKQARTGRNLNPSERTLSRMADFYRPKGE